MSLTHYQRTINTLLKEYNRIFPLPYYFERFLTGKTEAKIADLGSGPVCTLGNIWGEVKVTIYASDILANEYAELTNEVLRTPIEYQNMENLTYPNEYFDVVQCVNALDHTKNIKKAIEEMVRVCKVGGYIYLRHGHNQMKVNGGRGHYWNAGRKGFSNGKVTIPLTGFATTDDGYFLVSIMKK